MSAGALRWRDMPLAECMGSSLIESERKVCVHGKRKWDRMLLLSHE